MENLAPPLILLLYIRAAIENGESVRTGLAQYLQTGCDEYCQNVGSWFVKYENRENVEPFIGSNPYRSAVVRLIERGLRGESIHESLCELETELTQVCQLEVERHIQLLPMRLLIPLMFLQFPAYLVLVLGPLLQTFMESI
jgi:hypothetical protein